MGNNIGYSDQKGNVIAVERLGTNGSMSALMRLFAVGYAASDLQYARDARNYVSVLTGTWLANSADARYIFTTVKAVREVIALNAQDCFWADFHIKEPSAKFFRTKPGCRIYEGVLIPLILDEVTDSDIHLPFGDTLKKMGEAWATVLPFLEDSPAIAKLTMMSEMVTNAYRDRGILHIR